MFYQNPYYIERWLYVIGLPANRGNPRQVLAHSASFSVHVLLRAHDEDDRFRDLINPPYNERVKDRFSI